MTLRAQRSIFKLSFVFLTNDKRFNFSGFKTSSSNVTFLNKEVLSGITHIYATLNILY